jgi:hypothetical protein
VDDATTALANSGVMSKANRSDMRMLNSGS